MTAIPHHHNPPMPNNTSIQTPNKDSKYSEAVTTPTYDRYLPNYNMETTYPTLPPRNGFTHHKDIG
jgi:hypothetical protein